MLQFLENITLATPKQRKQELWDVEGILKNRSNEKLKFDLRPLSNNKKAGSFNTKADKMVFDIKNEYIIVDVKELIDYIKNNHSNVVQLEDLLSKLEWNIVLPK
jgi:hypothetical protein